VEPVVAKPSKRFPCRFLSRMESRQTADTLGVRSHNRRRGTARQWDYDTKALIWSLVELFGLTPELLRSLNKSFRCLLVQN
jgi:hypothetical protein